MNLIVYGLAVTAILQSAQAATAPSSLAFPGKLSALTLDYRLPPETDPEVLSDRRTEVWGRLYFPKEIPGPFPLLVFLHGNHGTCGYPADPGKPRDDQSCEYTISTDTPPSCPDGMIVTPNHLGYEYLAQNLVASGYAVISINANLGITCGDGVEGDEGLNLARGALLLKHLRYFYRWNQGQLADLPDSLKAVFTAGAGPQFDFTNVGLMGHSRGGEGVRAAYNLYNFPRTGAGESHWSAEIPKMSIRGIFEIGAVDGQQDRVLDATGTAWNQLLPMCDGDVTDLEGRKPFERMMANSSEPTSAQKSLTMVWGTIHNFYNTEWQEPDGTTCLGHAHLPWEATGSAAQRETALILMGGFFRSHLFNDATARAARLAQPGGTPDPALFDQGFNPLFEQPGDLNAITRVDRDFSVSPGSSESLRFADFAESALPKSEGVKLGITHVIATTNALNVNWDSAGGYAQLDAMGGAPIDISGYRTLDFRVGAGVANASGPPVYDFSIRLVDSSGAASDPLPLSRYAFVTSPGNSQQLFSTVRIPLVDFDHFDRTHLTSVRFNFDHTPSGSLDFAHVRFEKDWGAGVSGPPPPSPVATFNQGKLALPAAHLAAVPVAAPLLGGGVPSVPAPAEGLTELREQAIASLPVIKRVEHSGQLRNHGAAWEITLASPESFRVSQRLPVLRIGTQSFTLARFPEPGNLKKITFTISEPSFRRLLTFVGRLPELSLEIARTHGLERLRYTSPGGN